MNEGLGGFGVDVPSLRDVLDGGQDPLDHLPPSNGDSLGLLSDHLRDAKGSPEVRERLRDRVHVSPWDAWADELLADPSLVERTIGAITDPLVRAQLDLEVDQSVRPFPLEVELPEHPWTCDGCGSHFEGGEAAAVYAGYREGSTLPVMSDGIEPAWCADCVERAATAARKAGAR